MAIRFKRILRFSDPTDKSSVKRTYPIISYKYDTSATLKEVAQEISGKQAKVVFEEIMKGKDPKKVVEEKGMKQMSDASELLAMINTVLDNNPQSIEDFKNGKDRAVGFLVGQVMKASKGQANPAMTNKLIQEELKKR